MEGDEETPMSASAEALDSPSSEALGAQAEQARATLTPDPRRGCVFFCQPWCLLLTLTLLLLSLLGSWAVVHLTLGTNGGSPFRVSASYDQRIPKDDTATIEPHFTTNCTMGKLAVPCHSSQKRLWGNGDLYVWLYGWILLFLANVLYEFGEDEKDVMISYICEKFFKLTYNEEY